MYLPLFRSVHSILSIITFCFVWWFLSVTNASAADVLLSPASGSYSAGQTFTVTVQADPRGQAINAVEANLTFDTATLSVVNISKAGSAFSLWTTEPAFSNTAGTITFGGGSPAPFTARSSLVSITFTAKATGAGAVGFGNVSALAADGRGTDVLQGKIGGTYTVAAATAPPPTPPPTTPTPTAPPAADQGTDAAIAFGDPPRAPDVGSPAFLDPELWYNRLDGIFSWEIPFDVTQVAVQLAGSSDNNPSANTDNVYDPPIEEFVVSAQNLVDGIQYLSVQFRNQVGWGGITNRKIQIDTTAPEPFQISVIPGATIDSFPTITFEANDPTSGIERYELIVADREPVTVTPDEARLGYLLTNLIDGTYTVRITAFDRAGNRTESTVPVVIRAGWLPPSETAGESSFWAFFTGVNILILVLILVIALEFAYIIIERKRTTKNEEMLRKETREVQDQMEKIFSALRDEIYDQINMITKRPRLSKKEKEAVEGLNQALEVSETLIEKEINDVKKILK